MMIPALDLIGGRVVRLYQGDFNQQTTFDLDAVEQAQSYQAAGAEWLHLVDLDGAKNPQNRQLETLRTICAATNLNCQAGGGIRSTEDIEEILACGIKRVVIGSKAVTDPEQVEAWFKQFGAEKIVLALDVNIDADGIARVATHGWQSSSDVTLDDILKRFSALGCAHVLCTDISRDGTMQGSNVGLYEAYKKRFPAIQWQASGGVNSLEDIQRLKAANCDHVILGKSLLTGAFSLEEAIQCWQNASSPA